MLLCSRCADNSADGSFIPYSTTVFFLFFPGPAHSTFQPEAGVHDRTCPGSWLAHASWRRPGALRSANLRRHRRQQGCDVVGRRRRHVELACTGTVAMPTRPEQAAALSGLSGRRHGRWCCVRATAPSSGRPSGPSDLFQPYVTQMYEPFDLCNTPGSVARQDDESSGWQIAAITGTTERHRRLVYGLYRRARGAELADATHTQRQARTILRT